jgi:aspartate ammonia-lyase
MLGKVNPVIPEAVAQASIVVIGNDGMIAQAASSGNLELNQFMPLIAHLILESIELLTNAAETLRTHAIKDLQANEERCRSNVLNSTAIITAIIPKIGYEKASTIAKTAQAEKISVFQAILNAGLFTEIELNELISPESVCRLGFI